MNSGWSRWCDGYNYINYTNVQTECDADADRATETDSTAYHQ